MVLQDVGSEGSSSAVTPVVSDGFADVAEGVSGGVLVVDDDEAALDELVDLLRSQNIRSAGIRSGKEAIDFLRAEPGIDVVVSDVFMPRLGGIGLVKGIAERLPERPWIRTLLVSGRPSPDVVRDVMRTSAVEFLPKPIEPRALVDATRRALDIAARTRRRFQGGDAMIGVAEDGPAPAQPGDTLPPPPIATFKADILDRISRIRQFDAARAELLGEHLAMLPAWDMLLDLLQAYVEARKVSVSALCLATAAPSTTALRRIEDLHEAGLIVRQPDPADGRRVFITLTADGMDKVSRLLGSFRIDPCGNAARRSA